MAYASITKPSLYFNTKLWTGTGSNGNAISGVGFAPDLVWVKNRSETFDNVLFDRVRGDNKHVESNNNSVEENEANTLAFGSDGYSVGTNTLNKSGNNIVGWNWKANGTGSSNTAGSINTTYTSVNTTAGISISTYTGTGSTGTIGHGLGAIPNTIWVKKTSAADDWFIWHTALGAQGKINFNNTSAVQNNTGYWNNTLPTNQVFSVTSNGANNASGNIYVAYCFTDIKGYSKFGTYTGNGNANGAFVYTGFKPAWILIKTTDLAGNNWQMYDNKREGYNSQNDLLRANVTDAEGNGTDPIDILSNGFKMYNTAGSANQSGGTYIYMAFAEEPLVANVGASIPATAR